jgi:phosphatidylglycerophosphate synthase
MSHIHFAAIVAWLIIAIAVLIWIMACVAIAHRMERQGFSFRKVFVACALLSLLAGILAAILQRPVQPDTIGARFLAKYPPLSRFGSRRYLRSVSAR